VGGTGRGVAMGTDRVCTSVKESARYPARQGSVPCALPPEAFYTSPAVLGLLPVARNRKQGGFDGAEREKRLVEKRLTIRPRSEKKERITAELL